MDVEMEVLRGLREASGTPWTTKRERSRVPAINNLAFGKARKKSELVLPSDGHVHNNFRVAKALLRRRRGYGRRLGAVIRSGWPCCGVTFSCCDSLLLRSRDLIELGT